MAFSGLSRWFNTFTLREFPQLSAESIANDDSVAAGRRANEEGYYFSIVRRHSPTDQDNRRTELEAKEFLFMTQMLQREGGIERRMAGNSARFALGTAVLANISAGIVVQKRLANDAPVADPVSSVINGIFLGASVGLTLLANKVKNHMTHSIRDARLSAVSQAVQQGNLDLALRTLAERANTPT